MCGVVGIGGVVWCDVVWCGGRAGEGVVLLGLVVVRYGVVC